LKLLGILAFVDDRPNYWRQAVVLVFLFKNTFAYYGELLLVAHPTRSNQERRRPNAWA